MISDKMQMSDVLDAEERKKLMYDDHKLTRSEMYFTVGQLLRTFENWVQELEPAMDILRLSSESQLKMSLKFETTEPQAYSILEKNWEKLLGHTHDCSKEIEELVKRKADEIESLRDGVCPQ